MIQLVISAIERNLPAGIDADNIRDDADLQNDLGLDSLGLAHIATQLHEILQFDLQYFVENIGEIKQVSDLQRVVKDAVSQVS